MRAFPLATIQSLFHSTIPSTATDHAGASRITLALRFAHGIHSLSGFGVKGSIVTLSPLQSLQPRAELCGYASRWMWGAQTPASVLFSSGILSMQYLEWREKQYDLRVRVDVFGRDSSEVPTVRGALTYIASADRAKNLNYAGEVCCLCAHKATIPSP